MALAAEQDPTVAVGTARVREQRRADIGDTAREVRKH